jgi:hypothetical protein
MKFKLGKTYQTRSICDYDCIFSYEITKLNKGFVTVKSRMKGEKRRKIFVDSEGVEFCYPEGQYSMCPILRADKVADNAK